ncbi:MAG: trk system potassium uptake protein TrkH [Kiritimatiellia bacterium]
MTGRSSPKGAPVAIHRHVARPVGAVTLGLGFAMLVCMAAGPLLALTESTPTNTNQSFVAMAASAVITLAVGGALWFHGRKAGTIPLGRREAILVVAVIWLFCGLFGGLPYILGAGMSPANAFFEAVSGFTTTGATVCGPSISQDAVGACPSVEGLSRPVLLWRSLTQWLGGMGIVVLFVAVFPTIGVGGKHMYRSEVPGPEAGGLRPRIAETSIVLWRIYAVFTLAQVVMLKLFGMSWFDSVNHAFTTMSTGGFSTLDSSLGGFTAVSNPDIGMQTGLWADWQGLGIEWTVVVFMLIAGVNFSLYFAMLRYRSVKVFWRSLEFRVYIGIVVISTLTIFASLFAWNSTIWHEPLTWSGVARDALQYFRDALFMVATTITSTGYGAGVTSYTKYPAMALSTMLLLMFIGGSAGSTAGGIKVSRVILLTKMSWGQIRKSFRPSVVHVVRMGRKAIDSAIIADVAAFFVIYMACLAGGVLALSLIEDLSVAKAFGAMLTSLSNMGPAPFHNIGDESFISVTDNFGGYGAASKYVLSLAMILGRLEFFTLLALLLPDFWKR